MNELTAKAVSLAYTGRMPITAAATSMSRIAIHSRPMCAAHQVLGHQREHDHEAQAEQVLVGRRIDRPAEQLDRPATLTEPDGSRW
jgi:hypothetical protein